MPKEKTITTLERLTAWWEGANGAIRVGLWCTQVLECSARHLTAFLKEVASLPSPGLPDALED